MGDGLDASLSGPELRWKGMVPEPPRWASAPARVSKFRVRLLRRGGAGRVKSEQGEASGAIPGSVGATVAPAAPPWSDADSGVRGGAAGRRGTLHGSRAC